MGSGSAGTRRTTLTRPGTGRPVPIWGDESFADIARVTRTGAVLAAVRCATAGTDLGTAAVAPYVSGRWLFSHNGEVDGWPDSVAGLAATLPASALLGLEARVDSALLWALVRYRLELGLTAEQALADTVLALRAAGVTGRFNFLLTDGRVIAATAAGDTLWYRRPGRRTRLWSSPRSLATTSPAGPKSPMAPSSPRRRQQVSVAEIAALDGHAMQHRSCSSRTPKTEGSRSDDIPRPPAAAWFPRGSTARGRAERADCGTEVAAAQVVLRRAGQRAVRQDHRIARVLPDPRRTRDPAAPPRP